MRTHDPKSIIGQVGFSTRLLAAVLTLPVVISLIAMCYYADSYHRSISKMETVALMKPLVSEQVSEQVWSAVAGRSDFEACGAAATIRQIDSTLEQLMQDNSSPSRLELDVARRTMNTLEDYVEQIRLNLEVGVPIEKSEALLEEVRDVAELVDSMLEDYITKEVTLSAATNAQLQKLVTFFAAVEICLLISAFVVVRYSIRRTARQIQEPIRRLEHFAGLMAEGNLKARVPRTDVTELECLTEQVNIMADKLQLQIAQNRLEQENLKKSELRTLQAQINPHFLYNTLDAIIWQAESGHSSEVIRITKALSDFFRISLSSGADWIPVSQEIKHVSGYLSIQKTRYRDILSYELNIPESMNSHYMLKLLLQPLVENALYHGIKDKRGGGKITVSGCLEGDSMFFSVQDTGKGMTPEELTEVFARMRGEKPPVYTPYASSGSGFGLSNVDHRIRLYYGLENGLTIESSPGGTTVSFRIPCLRKEDKANDQSISG